MSEQSLLESVLTSSQTLGFLGPRPIPEVLEHARGFVVALRTISDAPLRVIDLGSGGGVPGLVIAHDLASSHVTLLDRRAKRTDHLERSVRRLGWAGRVDVVCADADRFARQHPASFDAAVARGFGPPDVTVRLAAAVVRSGGHIVISEPPAGDRWDQDLLAEVGVRRVEPPAHDVRIAVFERIDG